MVRLSVNINKIATLRNARGGNVPDLIKVAMDCEKFGARGITVHPRPDERHIKRQDVFDLKPVIKTEFNIEGYPSEDFIGLVMNILPDQVTLVPDPPDALTSNQGWDVMPNLEFLSGIVKRFKEKGIRTSIFIDPVPEKIEAATLTGTDRVELYTEAYAKGYYVSRQKAIAPYIEAAKHAIKCGLGLNAGHDLNLDNLEWFATSIEGLDEVSIGHALICDSLYYGLENTIQMYLYRLRNT